MSLKVFGGHDNDDRIMLKKDRVELYHWTKSMDHIDEELKLLLALEDRFLNDSALHVELLALQRENALKSSTLYRYGNAMQNARECDDVACDIYYLDIHEKHRDIFVQHLDKYRALKTKVFLQLLA